MTDIRDMKRRVPLSEDMLYSRMIAVGVLIAVPVFVWLLFQAWSWLRGWAWV